MMANLGDLMLALFSVSTATSLITQGVKVLLDEFNLSYKSNVLAGIVAIFVGVIEFVVFRGYFVRSAVAVLYLIVFVILSWLCAMLGYDKVVQTLMQIKTKESEE